MKSLISSWIAVLYIWIWFLGTIAMWIMPEEYCSCRKLAECWSLELEALRLACTDVGAVVYWLATGSWYGRMVSATSQRAAAVAALQQPSSSKS